MHSQTASTRASGRAPPWACDGVEDALSCVMHPTSSKARKIRDQLEARRRALIVRYKDTLDLAEAELADPSPEMIDVANDQWDARVLTLMSRNDATSLERIVAALRRLEAGTYGICTRCHGRIGAQRLAILPEAARCTECATSVEALRKVS
jgi:RNA polymerase-binding transcription factor DksA